MADLSRCVLAEYSEDTLRQQMRVYMVSCTKTYGLEIHQSPLDMTGIEGFLAHRYNFWIDDADHENPFK